MPQPMQANDVVDRLYASRTRTGNFVSLNRLRRLALSSSFFILARIRRAARLRLAVFATAIDRTQRAAGAIVLGISRDTVKAQKKFADKFSLKYPLLADADEKICDYFGVIKPKNMYGKMVKGVERNTYLIAPADAEGHQRLLHVWSKVRPEGHAEEVLAYLKAHPVA